MGGMGGPPGGGGPGMSGGGTPPIKEKYFSSQNLNKPKSNRLTMAYAYSNTYSM
jgi:hypothetical protein